MTRPGSRRRIPRSAGLSHGHPLVHVLKQAFIAEFTAKQISRLAHDPQQVAKVLPRRVKLKTPQGGTLLPNKRQIVIPIIHHTFDRSLQMLARQRDLLPPYVLLRRVSGTGGIHQSLVIIPVQPRQRPSGLGQFGRPSE